ncbi:MAG TPA: NAD(P)-binding domain-containing protein, partial [Usitatibacter sp.]|nr:NAD(P)-binding domain-containing protein [Usitatibacter sp.]
MSRAAPDRPSVGVVGLGIMGSAMSANLVRGGFAVHGFDVAAPQRAALARAGGKACRNAAAVAAAAPVVITSLPSADALRAVARELAAAPRAGGIVVETSTLPIAVKEEARAILASARMTLMDGPLSGTGAQARRKDLAVYASGPRAAYARCTKAFEGFARTH